MDGKLLVLEASDDPIEVAPLQFIGGRRSIAAWPSGAFNRAETPQLQ